MADKLRVVEFAKTENRNPPERRLGASAEEVIERISARKKRVHN